MSNIPMDKIWENFCKEKHISFDKKINEIKQNPGYSKMDDDAEWMSYLTDIIKDFCEYNKITISRELIHMIVCICDAHIR